VRGEGVHKSLGTNVPELQLAILEANDELVEKGGWVTEKRYLTLLKKLQSVDHFPCFSVNDLYR
jgi:hypothetical protein